MPLPILSFMNVLVSKQPGTFRFVALAVAIGEERAGTSEEFVLMFQTLKRQDMISGC